MSTLIFKLDYAPPVVAETLEQMGWREFDSKIDNESSWNLYWKTQRYNSKSNHNLLLTGQPWVSTTQLYRTKKLSISQRHRYSALKTT